MHSRVRGARMVSRGEFLKLGGAGIFGAALLGGCTGTSGGGGGGGSAEFPSATIEIMAPADPGGGWDQTARTMQQVFTEGGVLEENVEVYNVGGGSGTVGLSQFISDAAGDPHQLMITGLVMVGGIYANDSPVNLEETTPIASLLTEWEAIVVAADSEYEDLGQLVEAFQADPGSISWGGGSAGGTDHILVGQIARLVGGIDSENINYIAHDGGGEAISAILSGGVTAGTLGLNEIIDQVDSGEMRLLGISSDERIEGVDGPTMTEAGVDIVLPNWRAVVAPPDISDEDRDAIIAMIEEMRDTEQWQEALAANNWTDFFRTGDEFAQYLEEESRQTEELVAELGI